MSEWWEVYYEAKDGEQRRVVKTKAEQIREKVREIMKERQRILFDELMREMVRKNVHKEFGISVSELKQKMRSAIKVRNSGLALALDEKNELVVVKQ